MRVPALPAPVAPLLPGDVLAVIAPSGPFDPVAFQVGMEWLRQRFEVRHGEGIYAREGYLAGTDERRLEELTNALCDPDVKAILCARGGYGATRLLPQLDPDLVASAAKPVIGFSDVTALHALWARVGVGSLHASMVAGLGKADDCSRMQWLSAVEQLASEEWPGAWQLTPLCPGRAKGVLRGGNLAVLAALVGTPYAPPLDGAVLFLEDVGERPYRVDRMLTTLHQAGWFDRCAGVVLGTFTEAEPGPDGVTLDQVLEERLGGLAIPVLKDFPAGHGAVNVPLWFGAAVEIGSDGTFRTEFASQMT
ncbi:MAG: LD-carboxypeptidase [Verrucomicrobiales bacterium]|nr:LD-carboxypeptidase [Akkermansiaceae bacterium]